MLYDRIRRTERIVNDAIIMYFLLTSSSNSGRKLYENTWDRDSESNRFLFKRVFNGENGFPFLVIKVKLGYL